MKILIGIATYPTEPHIYPACQSSVDALDCAGVDAKVEYFGDDDLALSDSENLTNKHNFMRERVLEGDYDALLTLEADMVVPADALAKLLAVEADVAYALYCSRRSGMWECFPLINGYTATALNAEPAAAKAAWGTVIPSEGAGFGCTLIHRRVLEQVSFRNSKRRQFADDWPFALDVKAAGFHSAHHLGVVCGHILHDGGVMWPDLEAPSLHRVDGREQARTLFNGVELPERATYRVLKPLHGPNKEYRPDPGLNDEIELNAADAAVLLARRAIEIKES